MNQNEYFAQRVDDQIAWYDGKSQQNQRSFKRLRNVEIIAAALITLLSGYAGRLQVLQYIIGVLGFTIAVIAGVLSIYRFQENWTTYRATCEALKHEKFLFLTGTEPYNIEDPFALFVQRFERLISTEHRHWVQSIRRNRKE